LRKKKKLSLVLARCNSTAKAVDAFCSKRCLVAIVQGLVGACDGNVEILALRLSEGRKFYVELGQMCPSDFLIEFLREHMNTEREGFGIRPESNLCEDLVGERARHDKGRMSSGAAKVDEATFSEKDDMAATGHGVSVNLGLDVYNSLGVSLQPGDVDLNIEVTDVADNCILKHNREVGASDDITVAGGSNKDVGSRGGILHGSYLITSHGGLKGVDRIDFGDEDAGTIRSQGFGALIWVSM
jgi:hypothetical protein